ncbi:TIR domain-containing protein [Pseudomonas fulva]|uniref:TIR domain-containing protein n=1 Tax=Pseudomonas fulva TaxID=47880 RepID=UPI0006726418|nr:TIR domain-containing protein [Pseudomonas fulva]
MLKVFMSYTKVDQDRVKPFFQRIKDLGFDPWMDCEKLLPGQNWSPQIDQALAEANVVMLFISKASLNKRGFVQREANQAFENLKSKLPQDIYIIPLLLEPCEVPQHIADRLQFIEITTEQAWSKITASLELASIQQQVLIEKGAKHGSFQVFEEALAEKWQANPGYDTQISYPRFESQNHQDAALALTEFFKGRAARILIENRVKPWEQNTEPAFFGSDNGRWDTYSVTSSGQNFISVTYTAGWYGAGAAHPNSHYECYNFLIHESKIYQISLKDLFSDWQAAREPLIRLIIKQLQKAFWERTDEFPSGEDQRWIESGVGIVDTDCFALTDTDIIFFYSPYEVGPYALGSFSATVALQSIQDFIEPNYATLLAHGN